MKRVRNLLKTKERFWTMGVRERTGARSSLERLFVTNHPTDLPCASSNRETQNHAEAYHVDFGCLSKMRLAKPFRRRSTIRRKSREPRLAAANNDRPKPGE